MIKLLMVLKNIGLEFLSMNIYKNLTYLYRDRHENS
jgi:hypothetical protein